MTFKNFKENIQKKCSKSKINLDEILDEIFDENKDS